MHTLITNIYYFCPTHPGREISYLFYICFCLLYYCNSISLPSAKNGFTSLFFLEAQLEKNENKRRNRFAIVLSSLESSFQSAFI